MCTHAAHPRLAQAYPSPQPTNSLPLTFRFTPRAGTCLVIGSNRLAATRAFTFLEASARVIVAGRGELADAAEELKWRVENRQIQYVALPAEQDLATWIASIDGLSLICVTDTVISQSPLSSASSPALISDIAQSLRIPINITDKPELCTYTFPATHRFPSTSKTPSNLQVSVTTNGQGCRLATRIKREIVSRLPRNVGRAVDNIGRLRARARIAIAIEEDDLAASWNAPLNSPVTQLAGTPSTSRRASAEYFTAAASESSTLPKLVDPNSLSEHEQQLRRMRWISQISEYWSVDYLAKMGDDEMSQVLEMGNVNEAAAGPVKAASASGPPPRGPGGPSALPGLSTGLSTGGGPSGHSDRSAGQPSAPRHDIALSIPSPPPATKPAGRILLLGSGPGHPGLLTIAAHRALLTSTLILSDKLVPAEILALIPSTTELHIAKKFPGNAEGAQNEMMALALAGAERGEIVVRLKQGDPFVYGRGGEEVLFFRQHGFEPIVVPGVSSALAGPLMMGIPVTQRGVAESLVLCTGVGRKGKAVQLPGYVKSRTLLVLMGVARINQVLDVLTRTVDNVDDPDINGARDGAAFPRHLPIAIIERASSPDQRMIASTLDGIQAALETVGDQRPPGMMVIGWAALCLEGQGEVGVLDDEALDGETEEQKEKRMVNTWLAGQSFVVREGLDDKWDELLPLAHARAQIHEL